MLSIATSKRELVQLLSSTQVLPIMLLICIVDMTFTNFSLKLLKKISSEVVLSRLTSRKAIVLLPFFGRDGSLELAYEFFADFNLELLQ